MTKKIKLLALDIDGTIMGRDYKLHQPVKDAVKRVIADTDIKVVLASGRMIHSTIPIAKELGVTTPLIVYQGAMVKDYINNKVLFHQSLPVDLADKVIQELEENNIHVNLYINDNLYMKEVSEIAKSYSSARYVDPIKVEDFSLMNQFAPTKIVGIDYDTDKIARLAEEIQQKYAGKLNIFSSMPEFIEVVNPEINKGKILYRVAEELWSIKPENIMAVGDGNNDYDMIKLAGVGVAMGNATDKVKSVADFVTNSVEEFGLVNAINKIIFNGAKVK